MRKEFCACLSIGKIALSEDMGRITALDIYPFAKMNNDDPGSTEATERSNQPDSVSVSAAALQQLKEYLEGKRKNFTVPLGIKGTEFERRIWEQLMDIPYGQTKTYGQLARDIGRPKASRAVGRACAKNKLPIFIPCHRVIGKDGTMTGYQGGIDLKNALLNIERLGIRGEKG